MNKTIVVMALVCVAWRLASGVDGKTLADLPVSATEGDERLQGRDGGPGG